MSRTERDNYNRSKREENTRQYMSANKKKTELKFEKCCQNMKTSWQVCDHVAKLIGKLKKSCYPYCKDFVKEDSSMQAEELRTLALEIQPRCQWSADCAAG